MQTAVFDPAQIPSREIAQRLGHHATDTLRCVKEQGDVHLAGCTRTRPDLHFPAAAVGGFTAFVQIRQNRGHFIGLR